MTTSLEDVAAQVHGQAVEAAVRRIAPALGVDADQLLDSRAFLAATAGLAATAADFGERIQAAIRAAAGADPRFQVAGFTPTRSGEPGAAAGDDPDRQWTEADADRATPSELVAAMDKGLLTDLGCPPPRVRGAR